MKYLTLFIIALWMISMFVLAAEEQEGEKSQEVTDQEKVADTEDDSHDIDENQWGRRCFWTHCSRHNSWCPRGTYAIQERRCGRWGTSYCCARRHWGGGGGHHDHDEESNTEEQT